MRQYVMRQCTREKIFFLGARAGRPPALPGRPSTASPVGSQYKRSAHMPAPWASMSAPVAVSACIPLGMRARRPSEYPRAAHGRSLGACSALGVDRGRVRACSAWASIARELPALGARFAVSASWARPVRNLGMSGRLSALGVSVLPRHTRELGARIALECDSGRLSAPGRL